MALSPDTVHLPARGWAIDPARAMALGTACWIGMAAIAWAVITGRAGAIDELGLLFWRAGPLHAPAGSPLMLEAVRDLTALGGVLLRNLFALAAAVALVFLRLRREAGLLALTVAGGWLVNSLLKFAVGRARPEIVPHLTEAGGASFPSGHSFNAAVVYVAVALAFATMSARQSVRFTVIGAAAALSLAIAWSRVWLGVHFPTDALAGWLGGTGWALMAAGLLQKPAKHAAEALEGSGPDAR